MGCRRFATTKPKVRTGVTLIELLVSISVFAVITTVVIRNFRVGKERDELRQGAQYIASFLQRAQTDALAGKAYDFNDGLGTRVSPGGYGAKVSDNSYLVYGGDLNQDRTLPDQDCYDISDYRCLEVVFLSDYVTGTSRGVISIGAQCVNDGSVGSTCTPAGQIDAIFASPNGDRYLSNVVGKNKGSFCIQVVHGSLAGQYVLIKGNAASGAVTVSPLTGNLCN